MQKPETVSTTELAKAIESLKKSVHLYLESAANNSDLEIQSAFRDASIQRFEYCIEFSWKVSIKILGSDVKAAKPAVREMARNNLIHNPEKWLGFIDSRYDTSRAYDEEVAMKVFSEIESFLPEVTALLKTLEEQKNEIRTLSRTVQHLR